MLRGLKAVQGEWTLICIAFNLKRLHTLKGMKKGCRSGSEYVVECA